MQKYKERPKTSCVFYGKTGAYKRVQDGPLCTLTTYAVCDPNTCPWYKTEEMLAESYEKARQNFIKNYGYDGYIQKGYGPKRGRMLPKKNPDAKEESGE